MDDMVARLRQRAGRLEDGILPIPGQLEREAADEIERSRAEHQTALDLIAKRWEQLKERDAEIERLRAALQAVVNVEQVSTVGNQRCIEIAKQALEGF